MDEKTEAEGTFKHDLKNQLGIVLGFIELLIEDTPETDPRRQDMLEIRKAASASLAILNRAPEP